MLGDPGAVYFLFSDPFLLSFLIRSFPREQARVPKGTCSAGAGVGVICLASYLVKELCDGRQGEEEAGQALSRKRSNSIS